MTAPPQLPKTPQNPNKRPFIVGCCVLALVLKEERSLKLFYRYLIFLNRFARLSEEGGGLFFKERLGEQLAAQAWKLIDREMAAAFDRSQLREARK